MTTKKTLIAGGVDVLLLVALGCYFLSNKLAGKPYVRGFFCDDTSISYPAKKDHISWVNCLLIAGLLPLLVICVREMSLLGTSGKAACSSVKKNLALYIGPFIAGFVFEHMFVEIAKFNVGRLRPNFLDVCRPYFEIDNLVYDCRNTTEPSRYVAAYKCVNEEYRESLLSFPSGHTSIITFAMVFVVGYLQMRLAKPHCSSLLKPFLQICLLMVAWYISISRVSDFKHHWSDVLAGSLIGTFVAFVAFFYVTKWKPVVDKLDSRGVQWENRPLCGPKCTS